MVAQECKTASEIIMQEQNLNHHNQSQKRNSNSEYATALLKSPHGKKYPHRKAQNATIADITAKLKSQWQIQNCQHGTQTGKDKLY